MVRWASPALIDTVAASSVIFHFDGFLKGVIDGRDLAFFLSVIGFACSPPASRCATDENVPEKHEAMLAYSVVGLAALFLILVAANYLVSLQPREWTSPRAGVQTLSEGTKKLLAGWTRR